ncbi:hypothetical protein M0804_003381 [Polistes exclamans]|nr:hypothetical protein M0804_003381 [Polistes exclamans]
MEKLNEYSHGQLWLEGGEAETTSKGLANLCKVLSRGQLAVDGVAGGRCKIHSSYGVAAAAAAGAAADVVFNEIQKLLYKRKVKFKAIEKIHHDPIGSIRFNCSPIITKSRTYVEKEDEELSRESNGMTGAALRVLHKRKEKKKEE